MDLWPTSLSCLLLGPSPAAAAWGQSLDYRWVAYGFGWDFSSLSLLCFLYSPWLFTVGVGGLFLWAAHLWRFFDSLYSELYALL